MEAAIQITAQRLSHRRTELGMSFAVISQRSGVSQPTAKRILGGHIGQVSFANVVAVAEALGVRFGAPDLDVRDLLHQQARMKAEYVARLVQGNSALEGQAVDSAAYQHLIDLTYHELLAGPRRRLWAK